MTRGPADSLPRMHALLQVETTCRDGYVLTDKDTQTTETIDGESFTVLAARIFLPPSFVRAHTLFYVFLAHLYCVCLDSVSVLVYLWT